MRIRTALPAIASGVALLTLTVACSSDKAGTSSSAAPASVATTAAPAASDASPTTVAAPADTTAATTLAPTGDTTGAPATTGTAVDIAGFKFGPAELDLSVGDTVTWTNSDAQAHTATASGTFDTGSIAPGASAMATFDTAGTFAYICSFHPFMKATIVVK